jgi:hypothetical protein
MKPDEPNDVPAAFLAVFRDLVRAYQPRSLEKDAPRAYWSALGRYPIAILEAAAARVKTTRQFFPTTGEWYAAARTVAGDAMRAQPRVDCPCCGDRGLIRIAYRSGEAADLAICHCPAGQFFRDTGEAVARAAVRGLELEARVAYLEDFAGDALEAAIVYPPAVAEKLERP